MSTKILESTRAHIDMLRQWRRDTITAFADRFEHASKVSTLVIEFQRSGSSNRFKRRRSRSQPRSSSSPTSTRSTPSSPTFVVDSISVQRDDERRNSAAGHRGDRVRYHPTPWASAA